MLSVRDILKATRGELLTGKESQKLGDVVTDSRKVKAGDLFIAIVGEKINAHQFIEDVFQKGVQAVVVSEDGEYPQGLCVIRVKDTTRALGEIAAFYRRQFKIPVISITGSAGKTTTKEMVFAVLQKRYNVLKNEKTENNHFGVPQTILKLKKSHQIAVLELGTNQPGDIAWLTKIVQPTVAVWTNIGDSHLEKLKTPAGVFKEKSHLLDSLKKKSVLIFNQDDPWLAKLSKKKSFVLKNYSIHQKSAFQAQNIHRTPENRIEFKLNSTQFSLKSPARHNVYNALVAIACGKIFKVKDEDIKKALANFEFSLGRQEILKTKNLQVINDTYNSNPISFRSAVQTLHEMTVPGRKVLICGDMLELGEASQSLHEELGSKIAQSNIAVVISTGPMSRFLSQRIKILTENIQTFHCESIEDMHKLMQEKINPNDTILVKGSRATKMERAIELLLNLYK